MFTTPLLKDWNESNKAFKPFNKSNNVVCLLENGTAHYDDLATFLRLGQQAVVMSKDITCADDINKGIFADAGSNEGVFRSAVETSRLSASNSLDLVMHNMNAIIISADSTSDIQSNEPSEYLRKTITKVGQALFHASAFKLVILRHVTTPGEIDEWIIPLLESASGKSCGQDFGLAYMPASSDLWENALNNSTVPYAATDDQSSAVLCDLFKSMAPIMTRHDMRAIEAAGYMDACWAEEKIAFARKMASTTFRTVFRSSEVFDVFGENHDLSDETIRTAHGEQTRMLDQLLASIFETGLDQVTFDGAGFLNDHTSSKIQFARKLFDELKTRGFKLSVLDQHAHDAPSASDGTQDLTPNDRPKGAAWGGWASPSYTSEKEQMIDSGLILLVNEPEGIADLADRLGEDVCVLDLALFFPCT